MRIIFDKILGELRESEFDCSVADIQEAVRKSLTPYNFVSYLPSASPYTTPSVTAGTPTKVTLPTTVKNSLGFAKEDVGGGEIALRYTGTSQNFKVYLSSSGKASANNVVLELYLYKNGVEVPGVAIERKITTGNDTGAIAVVGEVALENNDYLEIYGKVDVDTTVTFIKTSIIITGKN